MWMHFEQNSNRTEMNWEQMEYLNFINKCNYYIIAD